MFNLKGGIYKGSGDVNCRTREYILDSWYVVIVFIILGNGFFGNPVEKDFKRTLSDHTFSGIYLPHKFKT